MGDPSDGPSTGARESAGGIVGQWRCSLPDELWSWSPQMYLIHGYAPSDAGVLAVTSELVFAHQHRDDAEQSRQAFGTTVASGEPYARRERIVGADGRERSVITFGELVVGPGGERTVAGITVEVAGVTAGAAGRLTGREGTDEAEATLAISFAEVARAVLTGNDVDVTLGRIVELAVATLDGVEHAGVTVFRGGRPTTPAASDDLPRDVDAIQYETGQGPCLDAFRDEHTFRTGDLATETRWPAFSSRAAAETGVRSMLSFRLFADEETLGALNFYSTRVDAFTDDIVPVGAVFAAHAALGMQHARGRDEVSQLRTALESSRAIGAAIGILMAQLRVTELQGFEILRAVSQQRNQKLRSVASYVLDTGTLPGGTPVGPPRTAAGPPPS